MCVTGGFVFSRVFSYHIPNLFKRCFMINFRNIRSPCLTLRNFNCSSGFSSKYFDVIEIVGIWRSFEFRKSLLALFNCFFTVVIVPWIHSLYISIREEVKSAMGSEDSLKFSGINLPVHKVLNRFQLALFNFHFGLWSSVEKVICSMMIRKWSLLCWSSHTDQL